jgi:myosin I
MRDRYWHNMAARIQRAFRNYMRYKNECARRIQRFWKNNKETIVYAQKRDYGHQILADRKERRRFSLLSYRRFMGDYLDLNGDSALGAELKSLCGIGGTPDPSKSVAVLIEPLLAEDVAFSSRVHLLVSKLLRSSKPSPRFLVIVRRSIYLRLGLFRPRTDRKSRSYYCHKLHKGRLETDDS